MSSPAFDFDIHGHLVPVPEIGPGRPMPGPKLVFKQAMPRPAPMPGPLGRKPVPADLKLDRARDNLLTVFGKATLTDRYLMPGESFQDMFARVACAYADGPVLYRLSGQTPEIIPVVAPLFEAFSAQLYFIYSGKKQNSREGIARYRALKTGGFHPEAIEKLTLGFLNAKTLTELETVIREHEMLVGEALQLSPVKAQFFQDYWGEVKSLGAWGGDFVLATSERPESETRTYFQQKGFNVVKPWKSMV